MLEVKVLGPGCANCEKLEVIARQALGTLGAEGVITKVTRHDEILDHGVLMTPGLVVNGRLVCSGRVPTTAEVSTWLANALAEA